MSLIEKAMGRDLGWMNIRGNAVPYSAALGVGPYFTNQVMMRINREKPCNTIITGEPGNSKTYTGMALGRGLQPKTFGIKNVVMTYKEFMKGMIEFDKGEIIVFDEPEYEVGHQEWYKNQNRALTATMRSGRFKVHPLFIPVINKRLLNKVIRENLIQYHINMWERGEGTVYRLSPGVHTDKTYNPEVCEIRVGLLGYHKCKKRWCPDCKSFKDNTCKLFRAQYEHKRGDIQDARYKEDLADAERTAHKPVFKDILLIAYDRRNEFMVIKINAKSGEEKKTFSSEKIELILGCSPTMAQKIRRALKVFSKEEIEMLCKS